jgi:hypothetical protein
MGLTGGVPNSNHAWAPSLMEKEYNAKRTRVWIIHRRKIGRSRWHCSRAVFANEAPDRYRGCVTREG